MSVAPMPIRRYLTVRFLSASVSDDARHAGNLPVAGISYRRLVGAKARPGAIDAATNPQKSALPSVGPYTPPLCGYELTGRAQPRLRRVADSVRVRWREWWAAVDHSGVTDSLPGEWPASLSPQTFTEERVARVHGRCHHPAPRPPPHATWASSRLILTRRGITAVTGSPRLSTR